MFSDPPKTPIRAYGAVATVIFAAATAPIAIRFAQAEGLPSIYIIALRLWIAVIFLAPWARRRLPDVTRVMTRRDWGLLLLAGTMHALGLAFLFFSLEYTSVLINSVIRRVNPLMIIMLEILLLHAVFSRRVWVGLFLVIAGSVIVGLNGSSGAAAGSNPLLGGVLALGDAFVNSVYVLIGRSIRYKIPFVVYSWLVFVWAALISSLFVLILGIPLTGYSAIGYLWVGVVAVIAQLLGHLPLNAALRFFPATKVGIFTQLSVALSAGLAFLLLSEIPSGWQIAGATCIAAGVVAANGGKTG